MQNETENNNLPEQPEAAAAVSEVESSEAEAGSQDTGEAPQIQAEPATQTNSAQGSAEALNSPETSTGPEEVSKGEKTWRDHLVRYHNDMNGLLAAKENLKIVAVNKAARPSFYKKWSLEANQFMRITAILRRRLAWSEKKEKAS